MSWPKRRSASDLRLDASGCCARSVTARAAAPSNRSISRPPPGGFCKTNPIKPAKPHKSSGAEPHSSPMPRLEEGTARTAARNPAPPQAEERMGEFHARLKVRGLKSTGQRDDIARVFFALNRHISAEELYR